MSISFQCRICPESYQNAQEFLNHFEIAEILLQNGAEVNSLNEFDFTPLHFAARNGHFAIVETLLKHGAEKDLKSYFNTTPLDLAKYFKRREFQKIVPILDV